MKGIDKLAIQDSPSLLLLAQSPMDKYGNGSFMFLTIGSALEIGHKTAHGQPMAISFAIV